ncbi:Hypothetical predicted protein [Mytilus galloprovincialis]|uniref:B box-type domain-containing protein n=1 Tax=Mytilus galloprovincialis TaxID=29158 RepID=A0A8B6GFK2_MYTGA|nr:Hypothetical predicted protein [Mytilus galloprovincialis]
MALSKPQLGIQSPILCQLCERDPKISWKCLECDLLMCSVCKNNIHPKIKTAGKHKIISIKDILSPASPNKDAGSTSPSSKDSANVDVTVVEEYQTQLDGVVQLAISLDDSLWIGEGFHKKGMRLFSSHTGLQKVKCERNKLKVISSFNIEVFGIAITPGNDLLVASDEPILKQIKSGTNKVVETVYNVDPYQPWSIYVTSKNKVIVGGKNYAEDKGIVIVMDQDGNHEKMYGEDQTKGISFAIPWKITATNNDHIFVIDMTFGDNRKGKVVVLGQEDIINTYSGHSVINTEDIPFKPLDVTTTLTNNVIVADMLSSTLHILNSSGHLITYISLNNKGIRKPISVELAMAGHFCMLYIGTSGDDHKDAKLYKLNMIGC